MPHSFQIADIIGDLLFLISAVALVILLIFISMATKASKKIAIPFIIALILNYVGSPIGMSNIFPGIFDHKFLNDVIITYGYWVMEIGYFMMLIGYFFMQKAISSQSATEPANITAPIQNSMQAKRLYQIFIAVGMLTVIACIFFPIYYIKNVVTTGFEFITAQLEYFVNFQRYDYLGYTLFAYNFEFILFVLTSILLPILFIILAVRKVTKIGKRLFLTALIINYLTNPVAWQFFLWIFDFQSLPAYWVIEGGYALILLGYFFIPKPAPKPHLPISQPVEEGA